MKKQKQTPKKITKDMSIDKIMNLKPEAMEVLFEFGLGCFGCAFSGMESLEQGALAHGMSKKIVNKIIDEINNLE